MSTKKIWAIIGILGLLLVAAITLVILMRPDATETPSSSQQNQAQQPSSRPLEEGAYVPYSEGAVSDASGRKLLFFHASWCPQCRSIEQGIMRGKIPDGMTIFKVDYDSNIALKEKYGVTLQTTFVEINDSGEMIKKHVAYDNPNFDAVVKVFEQ